MHKAEVASPGGIFGRMAEFITRWPLLVIGLWISAAAVLALALPPLPEVAAAQKADPLPAGAPALVTAKGRRAAFYETSMSAMLLIVLTDENGISPADLATYHKVVDNLRQDKQNIQSMQEFATNP